ncbi:MAG: TRAP transporter permease DctM/Q, partial [Pseudomonadota bacterium]
MIPSSASAPASGFASGVEPVRPLVRIAMLVCAVLLVTFHLALIFSGLVPNLVSRPLHLALALPWIFLFAPGGLWTRMSGVVLCAAGVAACVWIAVQHDALGDQYGSLDGSFQIVVAVVLLLVVLEAARRAIG